VKAALGKVWDEWQEFGDRMENVNRTALYKQLIAEGKTPLEAAFAARDMMDFSLQGSSTAVRFLTQIVPFMNARLQGLYKLGRSVKDNPARWATSRRRALASIALLLANKDDDDWKKREDWDRDSSGGSRSATRPTAFPSRSRSARSGTLAERSVELAISDEMTGKRFADRLKSMLGRRSPEPRPAILQADARPLREQGQLHRPADRDARHGEPLEVGAVDAVHLARGADPRARRGHHEPLAGADRPPDPQLLRLARHARDDDGRHDGAAVHGHPRSRPAGSATRS
jgi:hypothetical protein